MSEAPPAKKELRGGRYVLLEQLGQGTQGTTWDAIDKREGHPVAIKEFDVRGARAWKDVELAEREARVLSELDHPMMPHYVEHFEEDGALYLVMEKIDGTPLSVLQKKGPPLQEKDILRLLSDADRLFEYLHGRNPPVIHRDIKPSNIIRRSNGTFAFVDFGAVRDHLRPKGGSTVVGTFGYMAPEQFQGRASPGSDVYALGATVLSMMTGEEPEDLPHKGLSVDVRAALLGSTTSERLTLALARMLEPDPDIRAKRIAPLLDPPPPPPASRARAPDRTSTGAGRWTQTRQDEWRAMWEIDPETRWSRRAQRRAQKKARRADRRAARSSRTEGREGSAPFPISVFVGMALSLAQFAVQLALQGVVPIVLTILSLFFGQGLRRAAREVRLIGSEAYDAIDAARAAVRGESVASRQQATEEPRVRVSQKDGGPSAPRGGVRAQVGQEAHEEEEDDDEAAADKASRRMRPP
jgi:hypothetical protein